MKEWVFMVCAVSFLYCDSSELAENVLENLSAGVPPSQEMISSDVQNFTISGIDPSIQQPPLQNELQKAPAIVGPHRKKEWIAVSLSAIFPGLGHIYLDDPKTACGLMGTSGISLGIIHSPNPNEFSLETARSTLIASSFYGLYAVYRDTRLYNGVSQYSYPMPTDSLTDLATAPFSWSVLKKPEVWGGVLGSLGLATAVVYFGYMRGAKLEMNSAAATPMPFIALPVGVGEEALFRGYLQSALCETLNPLAGIILSSLAFGAAHIPNAQSFSSANKRRYYTFSLPLITGIGAYCGWLTHKNRSLKESVAMHTWYDFVLFSLSALAEQSAATGRPGFAFAVPF